MTSFSASRNIFIAYLLISAPLVGAVVGRFVSRHIELPANLGGPAVLGSGWTLLTLSAVIGSAWLLRLRRPVSPDQASKANLAVMLGIGLGIITSLFGLVVTAGVYLFREMN